MGNAARPLRRSVVSLTASLCLCAAVATTDGCGLDVLGTMPVSDASATLPTGDAAAATDSSIATEGGPSQNETCPTDHTICSGTCTDTTADPANCGGCGTKCPTGQTCSASQCGVLCVGGTIACDGACIDPKTSSAHCGSCTKNCMAPTPLCLEGVCNMDCGTKKLCPPFGTDAGAVAPFCADTQSDRNNCGDCFVKCAGNEICQTGTCKAVCGTGATIAESFGTTMYGCTKSKITYANRDGLCSAPYAICSASQWRTRKTAAPKFNYWTSDYLEYAGRDQLCSAVKSGGSCYGSPMRVCGAKTDPTGNQCQWTNCGYGGSGTNESFGGCVGNDYAGGLCCSP